MMRTTLSTAQIQQEISHRVHAIREVWEDRARIGVPPPRKRQPDSGGCNWEVADFPDAEKYEDSIRAEVRRAQEIYNLADE